MKIKNLESDRKQRIETLRETIRGCEREIRRLEENPDTCEEGIPGDPGSVLLEQGVYEHMMQRIEDTLNWWISAKVCQQDGKAIMSNPNNLLGKWLLRDVLELQEGTQITYEMLKEYGIDSVMFTKLDEGKYSIDFCELGTYEKVYGLEDIDAKNDVSDE